MELPKFLLGDNTDFPDDIFIIHLDYPRFIINLKDDEVEFLEEIDDEDEREMESEMEHLITLAGEFYDREKSLQFSSFLFTFFLNFLFKQSFKSNQIESLIYKNDDLETPGNLNF